MINRYLLTDEVIKKYTRFNCRNYIIWNLVVDFIFLFLCVYNYISFGRDIYLILMLLFLFIVILTFWRVDKTIKVEIERIHIRYGDEPQYMNIEFKDEIIISVKDNTMSIPYHKVLKYTQTKDFIMVKIKAKMVVVLKKDSFVQGSVEECVKFLDDLKHKM